MSKRYQLHQSQAVWPNGLGLRRQRTEQGFVCMHCRNYVTASTLLSGVQNRNHCPYCLWSRHVDLVKAGDRLAACKAEMQPVGLTLKYSPKKYGLSGLGELMLIHQCAECGKTSLNRIAADDDAERVLEIYEASVISGRQFADIHTLGPEERAIIRARLFGIAAWPGGSLKTVISL